MSIFIILGKIAIIYLFFGIGVLGYTIIMAIGQHIIQHSFKKKIYIEFELKLNVNILYTYEFL